MNYKLRSVVQLPLPNYETKKSAFKDNLLIWNTMGHIQMASIEMKEYLKSLSVEDLDEWE